MSEAHSAENFAKNFTNNPSMHFPDGYLEETTSRFITMERIEGIKINNSGEIEDAYCHPLA